MLFLSLLVLPACTIVLLTVRGFHMIEKRWLGWAMAVASNCASITLSLLIFRALPEPRPSSAASPSSETDSRTGCATLPSPGLLLNFGVPDPFVSPKSRAGGQASSQAPPLNFRVPDPSWVSKGRRGVSLLPCLFASCCSVLPAFSQVCFDRC
jgi:hypothetical protein